MIQKNMMKVMVAVALTLAVTLSSGIVGAEIGMPVWPSVSACSGMSNGSGGGC